MYAPRSRGRLSRLSATSPLERLGILRHHGTVVARLDRPDRLGKITASAVDEEAVRRDPR